MPALKMSTSPNWMGSMPSFMHTGSRMGVRMTIIGAMSMGPPRINERMLIMSKMTQGVLGDRQEGLGDEVRKAQDAHARTRRPAEAPIRKNTISTMRKVRTSTGQRSLGRSSR